MMAVAPRRGRPGLDPAFAGCPAQGLPGLHASVLRLVRLLVLVAFSALGLRSAPVPPPPQLAPAIALSYRAEHLKAAFRSGNSDAIQGAVQEVELLRRTYNTLDLQPLVEAMALFARQLGDQGQPALGLQVVQTMGAWALHDPTLLGTQVILMRQEGLHGYLWSLPEVLELVSLRLNHPINRWAWAIQHLAWLRLMATTLLWGWAFTLAMRYRRVFRYLWEEPLRRRRLNPRLAALLGALLLTAPMVLGLDPSLVAMLWLWLLAPFLLPAEVRITVFILLLQLTHPALALLDPLASGQPSPSIVALQMQPQPLPPDARVWAALAPADREFLLGWRQLQAQEWPQAEATFTALTATHPDPGPVWNNVGVARYQQGNVAGAQAGFDRAAAILPGRPEILLNQSVVAFKQMNSPLGSDKQDEASHAGLDSTNRMLAANHASKEQRTFAMPLPDSPARTEACSAGFGQGRAPAGPGLKEMALLFNLLLPLAVAAAMLLRIRSSISKAHPSQCIRCGDPFHTTDSNDTLVCSKCHHLFILKDGLHSESRKKKVDEVASFQKSQRWLHRVLLVFLPGADHCFIGDTRAGFVEYGFFCFALGIVLATGRSVRYPGEILADPASTWLPLGLVLLVVLFLRSWLKLLPRRS